MTALFFLFLIYCYDRKHVFTFFGLGPFYFFGRNNWVNMDQYVNYMYADDR